MSIRRKNAAAARSIKQQINRLLLIVSALLAVVIVGLTLMMVSISRQYESVLLCANTAADFNKEFKSTLDSEMYNHVIRPRGPQSAQELPLEELDNAEAVLKRLETATTLPDNRWRIRSMLDMCRNLRMYMAEIAAADSYDLRMELLDRNIRGETGLTKLIETYMHDFLDDEVRELARLRTVISRQVNTVVTSAALSVALLALGMVLYSVRITHLITAPIQALSQKAGQFGAGRFENTPVNTDITELQTLDRNFDRMAGQINALMEKQMADQRQLHRAELELLQAQINPHFLYNTLDSIAILAECQREEDVVTMVTSLSTFFRNSLSGGQDIISLRAELTQAKSYLEIQQIRYSDILSYQIDVPEALQDCRVPKLILQPLIENALYHGIKNRRGRGAITITGEARDGRMLLKVRDNGAGMTPEQLTLLQSGAYQEHHSGLGLKNVDQRIRLYCGEGYGLSFESAPGEGTAVTVTLPGGGIPESPREAIE